jgi:ubiquinone/menaquinone biosynthesis C-methylase UbiE
MDKSIGPMESTAASRLIEAEGQRVQAEYRRREREIAAETYAPWQPVEFFMRTGRTRAALRLLRETGVFPQAGEPCLEIGYGSLGWLATLIGCGLRENDLHGIEIDPQRAERAREALPLADLRVGSAAMLPWADNSFRLVVVSLVFTSILDDSVRRLVADEITRVVAPGGAMLWYDFAVNNPRNPAVRKVARHELAALFPTLRGPIRSVTLAPPLARRVVPWSWPLATLLETIPWLRTHLLAVLKKLC